MLRARLVPEKSSHPAGSSLSAALDHGFLFFYFFSSPEPQTLFLGPFECSCALTECCENVVLSHTGVSVGLQKEHVALQSGLLRRARLVAGAGSCCGLSLEVEITGTHHAGKTSLPLFSLLLHLIRFTLGFPASQQKEIFSTNIFSEPNFFPAYRVWVPTCLPCSDDEGVNQSGAASGVWRMLNHSS